MLEFFKILVSLIVGIAWPVTVFAIAYLFRNVLRGLFIRVSQLKYKDVEANFASVLAEAEAKVAEVDTGKFKISSLREVGSKLPSLRRIAEVSPRAAIMEAWILIEDAAGRSGFVQGAGTPRINTALFVEELVRTGKLPAASLVLYEQLRKLRNQAAHLPDFSISPNEADRYLELAAKLSEMILSVE